MWEWMPPDPQRQIRWVASKIPQKQPKNHQIPCLLVKVDHSSFMLCTSTCNWICPESLLSYEFYGPVSLCLCLLITTSEALFQCFLIISQSEIECPDIGFHLLYAQPCCVFSQTETRQLPSRSTSQQMCIGWLEISNQWPMGQTWPADCFYIAPKPNIVYILK